MKNKLFIVGTGGHSYVCTEVAEACGWKVVAYINDTPAQHRHLSKPVFNNLNDLKVKFPETTNGFIAIGDNVLRERWFTELKNNSFYIPALIHSSSEISPTALIGEGVFIGANVVISSCAVISSGTLVNHGTVIDHHAHLGEFCQLSSGCIIAGNASIGHGTLMNPGCVVEKSAKVPDRMLIESQTVFKLGN